MVKRLLAASFSVARAWDAEPSRGPEWHRRSPGPLEPPERAAPPLGEGCLGDLRAVSQRAVHSSQGNAG